MKDPASVWARGPQAQANSSMKMHINPHLHLPNLMDLHTSLLIAVLNPPMPVLSPAKTASDRFRLLCCSTQPCSISRISSLAKAVALLRPWP